MPKVSWSVSGSEVDEHEAGDEREFYSGPMPPKGVYLCDVEEVEYVKFSTGSKGLKVRLAIAETGDKKRYNGCPVWENVVDGASTTFRIRQWLDAIGATGADWEKTMIDSDNMVTKIGRVTIKGLQVRAFLTRGQNNSGEDRMEVSRFLNKSSAADDSGGSDDGDDDGDAPF